ncbi:hypothetical protein SDC9_184578 [bioreactor metagenome]|uniref:Uncharacterized protein n=1 Tax=bioreactor metagenome TaxID=1076179 RepID=A0A645HFA6_9ZZZZ
MFTYKLANINAIIKGIIEKLNPILSPSFLLLNKNIISKPNNIIKIGHHLIN